MGGPPTDLRPVERTAQEPSAIDSIRASRARPLRIKLCSCRQVELYQTDISPSDRALNIQLAEIFGIYQLGKEGVVGIAEPCWCTPDKAIDLADHMRLIEKSVSQFRFEFRGQSRERQKRSCCLLYTSPSPRDQRGSRMPSSA